MNGMVIRWVMVAAIASGIGEKAGAQQGRDGDPPRPVYGLFGGAQLNIHHADFRALPGVPNCCPRFGDDAGWGFGAGVLYEYPLMDNVSIGARLGYASLGATLSATEATTVIVGNSTEPGEFEHTIRTSISAIVAEPLLTLFPFTNVACYFGVRAASILGNTFEQTETLIKPEDRGIFTDTKRRTRNEFSGTISNGRSLLTGLIAGVQLRLPMNRDKTVLLAPELFGGYTFTPLVRGLTWSAHSIRVGAALLYTPRKKPEEMLPEPPFVPIPPEPAARLEAYLTTVGIDEDGTEVPNPTFRMEEFVGVQMRPLLPYVFFEENSAEIPSRYTRLQAGETESFAEDKLHNVPTLPTYHHILNIIGRRLQIHPAATITVTGCNSDEGTEKGNQKLSRERAESVRAYLRDVWSVDATRISIQIRNLPALYSTLTERDGIEENRRVEFASSEWEIMKPVMTNDTLRVATYPKVVYRPEAVSSSGVHHWSIDVDAGGGMLEIYTGEGEPPPTVPLSIDDKLDELPDGFTVLNGQLSLTDNRGATAHSRQVSILVERISVQHKRRERIADKYIDRYALILFDFDRADIVGGNRKIAEFIRSRLKQGATVAIDGFTDRIGDSRHNSLLSERRAQETRNTLAYPARAMGHGETEDLFDNNLPEGRMYCRTVNITVETPVEYDR